MDISNGENVGVALFVQGCHFHCINCFNSETWDFAQGENWTLNTKRDFLKLVDRPYIKRISFLGGEPLAEENISSVFELIQEIDNTYRKPQYIEYKEKENHNILNKITNKRRVSSGTKSIWLYTGYTWEEIFNNRLKGQDYKIRKEIVAMCDVLVDGRYIDSERDITLKYRGSKNQRVINVQESLRQGEVVLWCD